MENLMKIPIFDSATHNIPEIQDKMKFYGTFNASKHGFFVNIDKVSQDFKNKTGFSLENTHTLTPPEYADYIKNKKFPFSLDDDHDFCVHILQILNHPYNLETPFNQLSNISEPIVRAWTSEFLTASFFCPDKEKQIYLFKRFLSSLENKDNDDKKYVKDIEISLLDIVETIRSEPL